jgi:hypothetical protein
LIDEDISEDKDSSGSVHGPDTLLLLNTDESTIINEEMLAHEAY